MRKLEVGRVEGQEREKEPRGTRDGQVGGESKERKEWGGGGKREV